MLRQLSIYVYVDNLTHVLNAGCCPRRDICVLLAHEAMHIR